MNNDIRPLNIAICGFGGMGNWHRETIAKIDEVRLAGIFDIDPARQAFARELGIRVYGSWHELLSDDSVGAVTIATPNDLHRPLAIDAFRAGKHVVCEKPVALSSAELAQMASVADAMGVVFTVHQNRRWDEDFRTVRKILADGTLGPLFRIESCVLGCRGIPGDWRQLPERGGGMILDWGVHLLDQLLQLLPGDRIATVRASVDHVTNELVDDGFYAELGFASGVAAHVEVGTSHFITKPRWMVFGRDGSAQVDWGCKGRIVCVTDRSRNDAVPIRTAAGLTKTMAPRTDDTIREFPLPPVKSDICEFYRNFAATIDGRAQIEVKLPEVARVMRLMEAVRDSAASGETVRFES